MLGTNRDRLSIIIAFLEAVKTGAKKTRIMLYSHTNSQLVEKYLAVVIDSGFVELNGSDYFLTAQGREFLKRYKLYELNYLKAQAHFESLNRERQELVNLCKKSHFIKSRFEKSIEFCISSNERKKF